MHGRDHFVWEIICLLCFGNSEFVAEFGKDDIVKRLQTRRDLIVFELNEPFPC